MRAVVMVALALPVLPGCGVLVEPDRELIEKGERGVLGGYQGGTVFGWAVGDDDAPVLVRLSYAAEETVVSADRPREDLALEEGIPLGAAGFELEVGSLPEGSTVRAFIVESGLELTNSPITVAPPPM